MAIYCSLPEYEMEFIQTLGEDVNAHRLNEIVERYHYVAVGLMLDPLLRAAIHTRKTGAIIHWFQQRYGVTFNRRMMINFLAVMIRLKTLTGLDLKLEHEV